MMSRVMTPSMAARTGAERISLAAPLMMKNPMNNSTIE